MVRASRTAQHFSLVFGNGALNHSTAVVFFLPIRNSDRECDVGAGSVWDADKSHAFCIRIPDLECSGW